MFLENRMRPGIDEGQARPTANPLGSAGTGPYTEDRGRGAQARFLRDSIRPRSSWPLAPQPLTPAGISGRNLS
jgi:hypothetical protein